MLEDAASDALILDHGDQPHRSGAPRAHEHVHCVGALHEDSPRQPSLAAGVIGSYDVITRMNRVVGGYEVRPRMNTPRSDGFIDAIITQLGISMLW